MRNTDSYRQKKTWTKRTQHNLSRKDKSFNPLKQFTKVDRILNLHRIHAPRHLDLYNEDNRELTLGFIEKIEELAFDKYRVSLDFSEAETISAAALLLLYATMDDIKSKENARMIRFQSLSGVVKSAIEKSGLKALSLNKEIKDIDVCVRPLPIIKGTALGEECDTVIDHVQSCIFDNDMSPEQENIWATAVQETVSNVKLHAYTDEQKKPWWIICSVIGNELYLAICDKGVGIPNTISKHSWIRRALDNKPEMVRRITSNLDSDRIFISMTAGKTSTQELKHGLGSKSINAMVDENPDGKLWVFSNRGVYYRTNDEIESKDFKRSISGTLVQWNIKLSHD